ncbi:MAG TPA: DUF1385 domain-containing protein [Bacilli bacterium]|nr:DUF1385 domain-containing protein [Bacilli bacterium]
MEPQLYIGGQAVIEGVMMRGGDKVAVAVRKPDGSIQVDANKSRPWTQKYPWLGLPLVRGTAVLLESMVVGYKALNKSASVSDAEEEEPIGKWQAIGTLLFSLLLGVGLFVLLPLYATEWLTAGGSGPWFALIEGVLRLSLFVLYVWLISRMEDIQRVFKYHGAEHKTINCYEAGEALTVDNVRRHTVIHKRCGTSFLLFVMVIGIVLFSFFSADTMSHLERALYRLLLLPVVAGLSYELIRFSGNSTRKWLGLVIWPGLLMQRLTTREPEDEMLEVAIESVRAVVDQPSGDGGRSACSA